MMFPWQTDDDRQDVNFNFWVADLFTTFFFSPGRLWYKGCCQRDIDLHLNIDHRSLHYREVRDLSSSSMEEKLSILMSFSGTKLSVIP